MLKLCLESTNIVVNFQNQVCTGEPVFFGYQIYKCVVIYTKINNNVDLSSWYVNLYGLYLLCSWFSEESSSSFRIL